MEPARGHKLHGRLAALVLGASALLMASPVVQAHKASDAYLNYRIDGPRVTEQVDVALRDLDREMVVDADEDGHITWSELRPLAPALQALIRQSVGVSVPGQACTPEAAPAPLQIDHHSDGAYAVLHRAWRCPAPVQQLQVDYRLFATSDPLHRGLVRIEGGAAQHTAVLGPQQPVQHVDLAADAPASTAVHSFITQGMHHILEGPDHVLFLLILLLPAVLVWHPTARPVVDWRGTGRAVLKLRRPSERGALAWPVWGLSPVHAPARAQAEASGAWAPATAWRPVVKNLLQVVTAFTLAHSITLSLAVTGWLTPPSRWVEACVAVTVLLAALNNLWPVVREDRWTLTFAFGLIHGLAFAGALNDLGLHGLAMLRPLLGFNLGIELGQLLIVALFLPLAWKLRGTRFYRRWVLKAGSMAVALLALVWFAERAFELQLLS